MISHSQNIISKNLSIILVYRTYKKNSKKLTLLPESMNKSEDKKTLTNFICFSAALLILHVNPVTMKTIGRRHLFTFELRMPCFSAQAKLL